MNYLDLKAEYISWKDEKTYKENIKKAYYESIKLCLLNNSNPVPQINITQPHPAFAYRLIEFVGFIDKNRDIESINFGDSITDFTREWIDEIQGIFSVAGSWHDHITRMLQELSGFFPKRQIKYVFVGTSGGNPLLAFQDINRTIERSQNVIKTAREFYPGAKIIAYSLPPTVELQVLPFSDQFTDAMAQTIRDTPNACLIDYRKRMGGPQANSKYSIDGVHLNPRGARVLNQMFKEAKTFSGKVLA